MKKVLHSLPAKLLLAMVVGILLGFVLPESVMEVIVTAKYIMGQVITFCVPLIIIGFVAPLFMVLGFSFAEPRSFHAFTSFTLENFIHIFDGSSSVWRSFAWSIGLAAFVTAVLAVVCYPVAVGMVRVFGKGMSTFISILFVFPLFGCIFFFPVFIKKIDSAVFRIKYLHICFP